MWFALFYYFLFFRGRSRHCKYRVSEFISLGFPYCKTLVELHRAFLWISSTYLAEQGLDERIDHRSHKDRGLLTLPTVKMGWQATELERKGIKTDVGDQNRTIKAYNEQVLAYQTLKSTQSQTQEKSDERAKQLLGSRVVE